ncbi:hypothetical protein I5K48_26820 [Pseudomonas aeruginosa]|uniref:hypothetical protein n=1 Tax=Pseudomonas aeruginosa TaxID=287 RepID=UPI001A223F02|nr:hypothetical protein [Pseudomonas aeruginosa]MBH9226002.1 hypothetical protein [Pseudomonas aeruginosa]HBP1198983.1 hypothetical protein [Pseudomonas aeruginosa]HDU8926330.1 hypothetical protein [Pseudomonas aeruginosa]HDU9094837.1 hypothetical protein [Pseudomonas aeruginosa]
MQPSNKGLNADDWMMITIVMAIAHMFFVGFFIAGFINWALLDREPATIAWVTVVLADLVIIAAVFLAGFMRALILLGCVAYRWKKQGRAPQQPEVSRETEH